MNKTYIIKFRVTAEQKKILDRFVGKGNPSEFIRSKLFGDAPKEKLVAQAQKAVAQPKEKALSYRRFTKPGDLLKK